ncbi:DUF805 domain-containing protein [Lacisediminihabitans profunda]|uniref:DUF805 domain-containing protein n=1 Tax=Lacisediminihabitans profunda TaxID=2594790 RepID=A0A5C8UV41_9MICO|nr:DUF805 domain-containing protein [Lacisediminihabitans profunda]TXN31486.1 DUF805 domain-containing protein [Lacisediminihabitans profunda]
MTFAQSIQTVFRKYAEFTGRASRSEFWWFVLFSALGHAALNAFNLFTPQGTLYVGASLSGVFGIVILIPSLAVTVRRLRDAGHGWADLFWILLPLVGLIILIVHLCDPSLSDVAVTPQPGTPADASARPAPGSTTNG